MEKEIDNDNFDKEEIKQINKSLKDFESGNYKTGNLDDLLKDINNKDVSNADKR